MLNLLMPIFTGYLFIMCIVLLIFNLISSFKVNEQPYKCSWITLCFSYWCAVTSFVLFWLIELALIEGSTLHNFYVEVGIIGGLENLGFEFIFNSDGTVTRVYRINDKVISIIYASALISFCITVTGVFYLFNKFYLDSNNSENISLYNKHKLLITKFWWAIISFILIYNCFYINIANYLKYIDYINIEEHYNIVSYKYDFIPLYSLIICTVFFISFMIQFYAVGIYKYFNNSNEILKFYRKYGIIQYIRKLFNKVVLKKYISQKYIDYLNSWWLGVVRLFLYVNQIIIDYNLFLWAIIIIELLIIKYLLYIITVIILW